MRVMWRTDDWVSSKADVRLGLIYLREGCWRSAQDTQFSVVDNILSRTIATTLWKQASQSST